MSYGHTVYPRSFFAKLILQVKGAEKVQATVAASCAAMERSGDVLEMASSGRISRPLLYQR